MKCTTYEHFLDGEKIDNFDIVLLVFLSTMSSDELEKRKDYYDYYTQVPIVHFAYAQKANDEKDMKGVKSYLHKTCEKRLFEAEGIKFTDLNEIGSCVGKLALTLDDLKTYKEKMFKEMVLPAFEKFDKAGNNRIDLHELGLLLAQLGQPLTKEQLDAAMKDLDLNGDGVIDKEEFARWYFTGMKAYNGNTRSILQMRN